NVELQGVGEELRQQAGVVGVEVTGGDVLAAVDADIGVADSGAGDDVGVAVLFDVADGHVRADVELERVGEELGQQAGIGVGRVEGPGEEGFAVVDLDVGITSGGRNHQVLDVVVVDVADSHVAPAGVGGAEGGEVGHGLAVELADMDQARG